MREVYPVCYCVNTVRLTSSECVCQPHAILLRPSDALDRLLEEECRACSEQQIKDNEDNVRPEGCGDIDTGDRVDRSDYGHSGEEAERAHMASPPGTNRVGRGFCQLFRLAMAAIVQCSHRLKRDEQVDDRNEIASHRPSGRVLQACQPIAFQVVMRFVDPDQHWNGTQQEQADVSQVRQCREAQDSNSIHSLRVADKPGCVRQAYHQRSTGDHPAKDAGDKTYIGEIVWVRAVHANTCAFIAPASCAAVFDVMMPGRSNAVIASRLSPKEKPRSIRTGLLCKSNRFCRFELNLSAGAVWTRACHLLHRSQDRA